MENYFDKLPERCLELILDYLCLDDFNSVIECSNRLSNIGKEVLRVREIRMHQVLRQTGVAKWDLLHQKSTTKSKSFPSPRFGATLAYFEGSLYLFGGATHSWTTFNDLWRFDLSEKQWSRRIPKGTCPPPRSGATGILYKGKLIIIGGFQLTYSLHAKGISDWDNLPYIYDFALNEWEMIVVDTSTLPLEHDDGSTQKFNISSTPVGQSYCLLQQDQIIVFGGAKKLLNQSQGYHRQYPILPSGLSNETLSFSMSTSAISRVNTFGEVEPMKRCGHSAIALDDSRMLVLGGNLGPNTKGTDDIWLLTCVNPRHQSPCTCVPSSHGVTAPTVWWYWTKISLCQTIFQPPSPFLHQATVFQGDSRVASTLVVLGGATEAMNTALSSPSNGTVVEGHRLIVHSIDLSAVLGRGRCVRCGGASMVVSDNGAELSWSTPSLRSQDLGNSPCLKQGCAIVAGGDSLLVFGGLRHSAMCSRPLHLLNDLLVRDHEVDSVAVLEYGDLHRLSFAGRAISL